MLLPRRPENLRVEGTIRPVDHHVAGSTFNAVRILNRCLFPRPSQHKTLRRYPLDGTGKFANIPLCRGHPTRVTAGRTLTAVGSG